MQEVAGASVTVRVPAAQFDQAVRAVEKTGEVVDRQLKASDVTEEMRDLHIRLDNAEKLRQRLLGILEKSQKVEDAIKVEAELARVSASRSTPRRAGSATWSRRSRCRRSASTSTPRRSRT